MPEPTVEALTRRMSRLERRFQWLVAFGVLLVVMLVLGAMLAPPFLPGRYQIVAPDPALVHRLDTRTGRIQVFGYGAESLRERATQYRYSSGPSSDD